MRVVMTSRRGALSPLAAAADMVRTGVLTRVDGTADPAWVRLEGSGWMRIEAVHVAAADRGNRAQRRAARRENRL